MKYFCCREEEFVESVAVGTAMRGRWRVRAKLFLHPKEILYALGILLRIKKHCSCCPSRSDMPGTASEATLCPKIMQSDTEPTTDVQCLVIAQADQWPKRESTRHRVFR